MQHLECCADWLELASIGHMDLNTTADFILELGEGWDEVGRSYYAAFQ